MIDSAIAIAITLGSIVFMGMMYGKVKNIIIGPTNVDIEFRGAHRHAHAKKSLLLNKDQSCNQHLNN